MCLTYPVIQEPDGASEYLAKPCMCKAGCGATRVEPDGTEKSLLRGEGNATIGRYLDQIPTDSFLVSQLFLIDKSVGFVPHNAVRA